jgi:hypothetical protein
MEPALITAGGTILVAIIGAIVTWGLAKKRGTHESQASINDGFRMLINQLQEERVVAEEARKIDRADADKDRKAMMAEITQLRDDVRSLEAHVSRLEHILQKHEITFQPLERAIQRGHAP